MRLSSLRGSAAIAVRRAAITAVLFGSLLAIVPANAASLGVQDFQSVITAAGESENERADLRAIYEGSGNKMLWTTPARRLAVMKMVVDLDADGIDSSKLGALPRGGASSPAEDDVLATRAVLRASRLLSAGSVDASTIPGWAIAQPKAQDVQAIAAAVRDDRVSAFLDGLRPRDSGYQRLREAYVRYRRLAGEPWPDIAANGPRIMEESDPRWPSVLQRLVLLGDLGDENAPSADAIAAIKAFQTRHGLDADGRVGPATLEQLRVRPAVRADQIAVNLEYWRLLPRAWPNRYVAVNIAAADLNVMGEGKATFTTRVIVGDIDHPTPVLQAEISAVTFNPPWTVPYSIASKELLPKLKRDPLYLEKNDIEIVGRTEDRHGLTIDWSQYSRSNFPFQLRQVPGKANALGLVKFEMPNQFDVYLHDTPNRSLFEKNDRALSHGCVRVQCAQELAEHLIDDPAIWITTDFKAAVDGGRTTRLPLKQPLPVYLLYFTAFVASNGAVNFRPDIYAREPAVQRALAGDYTPPPVPASPKGD